MSKTQQEQNQEDNKEQKKSQMPTSYKLLYKLDFFKFLPVPKTNPVTSKKSIMGSVLMFTIFFGYLLFSFIDFATNNSPMVNQYNSVLPPLNITMPNIAFSFFTGDPINATLTNPSIIQFQFTQHVKSQDMTEPETVKQIELVSCQPDWIPDAPFPLLCPTKDGVMSGALYTTTKYIYPRLSVSYCENSENITCNSQYDIQMTIASGKILLYIQNAREDFNHASREQQQKIPYEVFEYFLLSGLLARSEIYFEKQSFTINPDYFTNFITQQKSYLSREFNNDWLANVTVYNPYLALEIDFRMQQYEVITILNFLTIFDMISMWGAMWSVLYEFSAFAAYFLAYNADNFYKENQEWNDFSHRISVQKPKDQIDHPDQYHKQQASYVFGTQEQH